MMSEWLGRIEFWHWLILGLGLGVLEVMAPGAFFIWPGLAAIATGILLLAVPALGWEIQFLFFAVLSIVVTVGGRTYVRRRPIKTDDSRLNRRAEQYVGRTLVVEQAIVNGRGVVNVDDSVWRIEGPDLPAGARVKVVGVDGALLRVKLAE